MKTLNRNARPALMYRLADLDAAKRYMYRIPAHVPGSYVGSAKPADKSLERVVPSHKIGSRKVGETAMAPSFDIVRIDPSGRVLWCGAVESFEAAKVRIQKLARCSPGEYLILDQDTGDRVLVMLLCAPSTQSELEHAEKT